MQTIERVGVPHDWRGVIWISRLLDDLRSIERGAEEDRGAGEPVLRGEGAEKKKVVAGADFVSGEVRDDENRTRRAHPRSRPSRSTRAEDFGGDDRHERDYRHS